MRGVGDVKREEWESPHKGKEETERQDITCAGHKSLQAKLYLATS